MQINYLPSWTPKCENSNINKYQSIQQFRKKKHSIYYIIKWVCVAIVGGKGISFFLLYVCRHVFYTVVYSLFKIFL